MKNDLSFDVVVIGGGHAGCEAAAASARMGVNTGLFTHKIETIGEMSCNPAIGGLGKGHLVKEIDALDGVMGVVADKSGIQFRLLNRSRGPAVRGPRTQSDRALYKKYMQKTLLSYCNLRVFSDPVIEFIFDKNQVVGFNTKSGKKISCKKMILTTGTFLNGLIHIGDEKTPAGRHNEKPSTGLSEQLEKFKMKLGRLKTGTPPRIDKKQNPESLANLCGLSQSIIWDSSFIYTSPIRSIQLIHKGHRASRQHFWVLVWFDSILQSYPERLHAVVPAFLILRCFSCQFQPVASLFELHYVSHEMWFMLELNPLNLI